MSKVSAMPPKKYGYNPMQFDKLYEQKVKLDAGNIKQT